MDLRTVTYGTSTQWYDFGQATSIEGYPDGSTYWLETEGAHWNMPDQAAAEAHVANLISGDPDWVDMSSEPTSIKWLRRSYMRSRKPSFTWDSSTGKVQNHEEELGVASTIEDAADIIRESLISA